MPLNEAPPPGWYQEAEGSKRVRWWDGAKWTDHFRHEESQSSDPEEYVGRRAKPVAATSTLPPSATPKDGSADQQENSATKQDYEKSTVPKSKADSSKDQESTKPKSDMDELTDAFIEWVVAAIGRGWSWMKTNNPKFTRSLVIGFWFLVIAGSISFCGIVVDEAKEQSARSTIEEAKERKADQAKAKEKAAEKKAEAALKKQAAQAKREACLDVPSDLVDGIGTGLDPRWDYELIDAAAVKSKEHSKVYFVGISYYSEGLMGEQTGVWATNSLTAGEGLIYAVDGFAGEFTDWPDSTVADSMMPYSEGVGDVKDCLG